MNLAQNLKLKASFSIKYGENIILSISEIQYKEEVLPVSWSSAKCTIIKRKIIKGRIKCRTKNNPKVELLTENPPQIHRINLLPI